MTPRMFRPVTHPSGAAEGSVLEITSWLLKGLKWLKHNCNDRNKILEICIINILNIVHIINIKIQSSIDIHHTGSSKSIPSQRFFIWFHGFHGFHRPGGTVHIEIGPLRHLGGLQDGCPGLQDGCGECSFHKLIRKPIWSIYDLYMYDLYVTINCFHEIVWPHHATSCDRYSKCHMLLLGSYELLGHWVMIDSYTLEQWNVQVGASFWLPTCPTWAPSFPRRECPEKWCGALELKDFSLSGLGVFSDIICGMDWDGS